MAIAFRRKGSRIVGTLDGQEREVVASVLSQVRELLGGDEVAPTGDPLADLIGELDATTPAAGAGDPALARLLPDGHADGEEAAEFRALTERSLRQRKVARLDTVLGILAAADRDRIELDFGQAQELMIALTDARLVLADRLGLHTEEDAEQLDTDHALGQFYDFFTWLQEGLATALLSSGERGRAR